MSDSELRAPWDGVVLARYANSGDRRVDSNQQRREPVKEELSPARESDL
ncbi:MAG: hypothetical protein ACREP1_02460 [Rhodanobacteraceae bacterium]